MIEVIIPAISFKTPNTAPAFSRQHKEDISKIYLEEKSKIIEHLNVTTLGAVICIIDVID